MPLHDRRYKRLHRPKAVNLEWALEFSAKLGLGQVIPDSVVPHKVEYLTEELSLRLADHAWSFRTDCREGLLLLMEFQSSTDAALVLRQYTYAFMHLLAGLETREYTLSQGLPVPILVSLYNGLQKWQPRPLEDLFAGGLDRTFPLPWIHYDMLHMEPSHLPTRPLLRAIFDIERTGRHNAFDYATVLQSCFAVHQDPELRRTLFAFTTATMGRWQHAMGPDGTPLNLDIEWEAINTLEEMIMAQEMLQTQLDTWILEGQAEGRAEGRAEGQAEGQAQERRQALLELVAVRLEPHEVEQCRMKLAGMTLDEMPTVGGLYRALQNAGDDQAEIMALFQPPAFT